jgi:hypothetical protein
VPRRVRVSEVRITLEQLVAQGSVPPSVATYSSRVSSSTVPRYRAGSSIASSGIQPTAQRGAVRTGVALEILYLCAPNRIVVTAPMPLRVGAIVIRCEPI